jgi:hypothetical protein
MPYNIYFKKEIQNEISRYKQIVNKTITVTTMPTITDGFLVKNNVRIPVCHILFIEEV